MRGILCDPQVLPNRKIREKTNVLKRAGNSGSQALMRWFSIHRLSEKGYRPRGFRVHTANKIDRCALAGTIRSDQTKNLTLVDGKVQIIYRFDAAEMFGQTTELKHWYFSDFPARLHVSGFA